MPTASPFATISTARTRCSWTCACSTCSNLPAQQTFGFFWEIYNATNRVNFDNPIGNRRSTDFLRSVVADDPRSMQLGFRYTF